MEENKLPDFVDYDAYDSEVFKCAQTKPRPQTLLPGCNPYTPNKGIETDTARIEKFLAKENLRSDSVEKRSSSVAASKKHDNVIVFHKRLNLATGILTTSRYCKIAANFSCSYFKCVIPIKLRGLFTASNNTT